MAADPVRRGLLAAAAALPLAALAGCDGADVLAAPPRPAPDVGELRGAITAEELMIARYQAVLRELGRRTRTGNGSGRAGGSSAAAGRPVTALVTSLLAEHRAHLGRLRSRLVVPPGSAAAASASASASAAASARARAAAAVPAAPTAALAFLAAAERDLSDALLRRLPGLPASLAELFTSISASEATHVPALRGAGGR